MFRWYTWLDMATLLTWDGMDVLFVSWRVMNLWEVISFVVSAILCSYGWTANWLITLLGHSCIFQFTSYNAISIKRVRVNTVCVCTFDHLWWSLFRISQLTQSISLTLCATGELIQADTNTCTLVVCSKRFYKETVIHEDMFVLFSHDARILLHTFFR